MSFLKDKYRRTQWLILCYSNEKQWNLVWEFSADGVVDKSKDKETMMFCAL